MVLVSYSLYIHHENGPVLRPTAMYCIRKNRLHIVVPSSQHIVHALYHCIHVGVSTACLAASRQPHSCTSNNTSNNAHPLPHFVIFAKFNGLDNTRERGSSV